MYAKYSVQVMLPMGHEIVPFVWFHHSFVSYHCHRGCAARRNIIL